MDYVYPTSKGVGKTLKALLASIVMLATGLWLFAPALEKALKPAFDSPYIAVIFDSPLTLWHIILMLLAVYAVLSIMAPSLFVHPIIRVGENAARDARQASELWKKWSETQRFIHPSKEAKNNQVEIARRRRGEG